MINLVGKIDGVNLYSDEYTDEYRVIKGRKQGVEGYSFIVTNPKTAQTMFIVHRIQKIKKLKDRIINVTTI